MTDLNDILNEQNNNIAVQSRDTEGKQNLKKGMLGVAMNQIRAQKEKDSSGSSNSSSEGSQKGMLGVAMSQIKAMREAGKVKEETESERLERGRTEVAMNQIRAQKEKDGSIKQTESSLPIA